jgi:prepilin-type N-terminal cleavage/methylation domain-containing protein
MLRQRKTNRSGFTLPEVLVTVAIVAVLAAVVVPTVTSQIGKGDDANFQAGVSNVRTGITAFVSDTRRFPRRLSHLYQPITGLNDLFANPFGGTASRWKGPYASGSMLSGDSLPLSLGFLQDSLIDSNLVAGTSGFVVASLLGVTTTASAARLDTLIDGATGNDAGILQWPAVSPFANGAAKLALMGSR